MIPSILEATRPYILPVIYALVIVAVLPLMAGYIVLLERKVMAHMQARMGPMRVGPHGLLQPIADAVKLLLKEDIIPDQADKLMFWLAPLASVSMALLAYAALPLGPSFQIADLDVGLLFILAVSSLGIYGIVLGGWASNSHYSLLGALRSAAQLVSYETAAGLALVSGLLFGGSLSMKALVEAQDQTGVWFIFVLPISFFIYMVASIAETNRAPFDLPEAESELVAGYMTEYSGFRWSLYFLAEYANMIVVAGIATTLFLGGWLRPLASIHLHLPGTSVEALDTLPALIFLGLAAWCFKLATRQAVPVQKMVMFAFVGLMAILAVVMAWALVTPFMAGIHGAFWFIAKILAYLYGFLWFRFTFPRYRFDQLMRLGWQFLIPLALVNLLTVAVGLVLHQQAGWWLLWSAILSNGLTLAFAGWLLMESAAKPGNEAERLQATAAGSEGK
ncbi:MAG TPA: complex I subunit 1 family protein [Candidatus Acidoferrales bacterium]|nr:complex I subunit 1 family protein [Candidatus Acidoferrales bacterium]